MPVDEDLPSQKKAPLPFFSFMQPVPTLLSLLWQPALSPWALHASNQSETFVEIPPGFTYSTYPTSNSLRTEKAGTKRGETPSPELGMT